MGEHVKAVDLALIAQLRATNEDDMYEAPWSTKVLINEAAAALEAKEGGL